ncbi:MAG: hypothetical protein U1F54_10225 [Burkholderiales bacterium]
MSMQLAIVSVIVAACALHALVTLAPAGTRRRIASWLLRLPFLRGNARLARAATATGACGCAGCDRARPAADPAGKRKVIGKVIALRRVG